MSKNKNGVNRLFNTAFWISPRGKMVQDGASSIAADMDPDEARTGWIQARRFIKPEGWIVTVSVFSPSARALIHEWAKMMVKAGYSGYDEVRLKGLDSHIRALKSLARQSFAKGGKAALTLVNAFPGEEEI